MSELEFSNVKSLRKSLLITSFIGILLVNLCEYSTGSLKLLLFEIPIQEASFLPNHLAYLIIFFLIALIGRYANDEFYKTYIETLDKTTGKYKAVFIDEKTAAKRNYMHRKKRQRLFFKWVILSLDIIFPIVFGIGVVIYILIK